MRIETAFLIFIRRRNAQVRNSILILQRSSFLVGMLSILLTASAASAQQSGKDMPRLVKHVSATQLYVNDKPFLILGGEFTIQKLRLYTYK